MRFRIYVVLLALAGLAIASAGDRSLDFHNCLGLCQSRQCIASSPAIPVSLRLTGWTCTDDCKYGCMHALTDKAVANGEQIEQYYGKWPFWRLMGMQEPASVAFSLLNLWVHVRGAQKIRGSLSNTHPMRPYYIGWTMVNVNAWIWSSVFHTRDLPWTEKLDYFSAALVILYALWSLVVRLFRLYALERSSQLTLTYSSDQPRRRVYLTWSCLAILAYIGHISYLGLSPRFDYGYNVAFNLTVGMTHNLLWLVYAMPSSFSLVQRYPYRQKSYRPSYVSWAAVFVLLTTMATALELFDFPPVYRVIDAHSLWHLSTAPIAMFWYNFLLIDARDEGWRDRKSE